MRTIALLFALALLAGGPAHAYWQYAEWGMTPTQVAAAGRGQAVPCQPGAAACANGAGLVIENVEMLGMPASVAFFFDGQGRLNGTVVTFKNADFGLISGLLQGIHGPPVTDEPGPPPTRIYRDTRRGSTITATGAGPVTMSYKPTAP
jgi:hypothetical protein